MVGGQFQRIARGGVESDLAAVAEKEVAARAEHEIVCAGPADKPPRAVARGDAVVAAEAVGGVGHAACDEVDGSAVHDDGVVAGAHRQAVGARAENGEIGSVLRGDGVVPIQRVMRGGQRQRVAGHGVECNLAAVAQKEIAACAEREPVGAGAADEDAGAVSGSHDVIAAARVGCV